jgi:hypothetical protein
VQQDREQGLFTIVDKLIWNIVSHKPQRNKMAAIVLRLCSADVMELIHA